MEERILYLNDDGDYSYSDDEYEDNYDNYDELDDFEYDDYENDEYED